MLPLMITFKCGLLGKMMLKNKIFILFVHKRKVLNKISFHSVNVLFVFLLSFIPFIQVHSFSVGETKELALKGDINAQIQLGVFYNKGLEKDFLEAYYWMKMAAKQNHPFACRYLGRAHFWGQGTSKSIDLAIQWFLLAANKGDKLAMYEIGKCKMIKHKPIHAAAWYKLSHEYGYIKALEPFQSISQKLNDSETEIFNNLIKKIQTKILLESKSLSLPSQLNTKPIRKLDLKSGEIYWGHVIDDVPNGFGKKKSNHGTTYQGEFKEGLEHGYGISFGINGEITFEGNWIMGKPVVTHKKIRRNQSNF